MLGSELPAQNLSAHLSKPKIYRQPFVSQRQAIQRRRPRAKASQDPFANREKYEDAPFDRLAMWLVASKLKEELGPSAAERQFSHGYEGFVELSKEIMKGRSTDQQRQVIARVLCSLLPPTATKNFRRWIPFGKWSAETNARITKIGFFWLVGEMTIQDLEVEFGGKKETWQSGVLIKKCRYLETSGCKAMCVNMCKRPTQDFFTKEFGLPLTMAPNFDDLSCEMKFGVAPPSFQDDEVYNEPCFSHVCSLKRGDPTQPCPKMDTERWKHKAH